MKKDIKLFLTTEKNKYHNITKFLKKYHPEVYHDIIESTPYLSKNCKFSERIYQILNDMKERPKCYCGHYLYFLDINLGYRKFCSVHCTQNSIRTIEKKKQTKLQKYGNKNYCNSKQISISQKKNWDKNKTGRLFKIKKTSFEKYGIEFYNNIEKRKRTCLKKYGVESTNQLQEVKEKKKQTCLERYGVDHPLKLKKIKEKARQTTFRNHYLKLFKSKRLKNLLIPLFSLDEYGGTKAQDVYYKFQCVKCNTIFTDRLINGRIPRCFKCYPISNFTKPHKIICDYLEEKNIKFEVEKYIKPYSVDIFIEPDKIIEIYGDYWHGNPKFYKKGDIIHFNKEKSIPTEQRWKNDASRIKYLESKNNKVLILWEDEIKNNFEIIKEKIKEHLN